MTGWAVAGVLYLLGALLAEAFDGLLYHTKGKERTMPGALLRPLLWAPWVAVLTAAGIIYMVTHRGTG